MTNSTVLTAIRKRHVALGSPPDTVAIRGTTRSRDPVSVGAGGR